MIPIPPLDDLAFAAFKARCKSQGKALPRPAVDRMEVVNAKQHFDRTQKPSIRVWGDFGGRTTYWFTYPTDIGALRVSRTWEDLGGHRAGTLG